MQNRHKLRLEFWEMTLEAMKASPIALFRNVSPSKEHWLNTGSGITGCPYTMIFGKKMIRVLFEMNRQDRDENKAMFDALYAQKGPIEAAFGAPLAWLRLEDKKSSRLQFEMVVDGYDKTIGL